LSVLAKRVLLAALTGIGLVLLVVGAWLSYHLGSAGSASFRADPRTGVVVLEPSVLNRVDDPVTVTARSQEGAEIWIGRATPSDARAVVGATAHTAVTGADVRSWTLDQTRRGSGTPKGELAAADVWRQASTGRGSATLEVDQGDAPETLVVTTRGEGDLTSVTLTIERRTWLFQSLLVALVGLLAAVGAGVALAASFRRDGGGDGPDQARDGSATEVTA